MTIATGASVTEYRPRPGAGSITQAIAGKLRVQRRVGLAWGLLVLNVLTFDAGGSFLPIPSALGQIITQGALPLALLLALGVNRKVLVRPNIFLLLVSLLLAGAIVTSMNAEDPAEAAYRTFRLAEFVITLWLLSPYWGERDLLLVRCHLKAMMVVLVSVIIGLAVSPGHALVAGRLVGALWPIPPTQVAHYAAVTIGLVSLLWLCRRINGRVVLPVAAIAGVILLMTGTRTALIGLTAGLAIAGLSLVATEARARKLFAFTGITALAVAAAFPAAITSWLARGENVQLLTSLSGRTSFWGPLLAFPRNNFQELFGFGLSNGSFNGNPIDSNWLISYQEQGLFGVAVCVAILICLSVAAYFQPPGVRRALALFLLTYCLIASFTEVGFTDASTYMLDLTVAASLLVPPALSRSGFLI